MQCSYRSWKAMEFDLGLDNKFDTICVCLTTIVYVNELFSSQNIHV